MSLPNRHHDRISEELKTARESLTHATRHLEQDAEIIALDEDLKDATARRDTRHDEATKAADRIREWLEEAKDQVIDKLEDLKTDFEIHRIEKDADRKEDHARDAIVFAAHAVLEAEVALIEALKARRLAIEVAG